MRKYLTQLLIKSAFKVLDKNKVRYYLVEQTALQSTVDEITDSVEKKFGDESGQYKRNQVLLATMNVHPDAKERDIAFAIELSIRRYV